MAYDVVWEERGIYKRFYGSVSADEFMQSIKSMQGDRRFDTARYSINDFLSVQKHMITEEDVKLFAAYAIGAFISNPNIKIAILTTDQSIISLVTFYSSPKMSPFPLQVFSNLADARNWIAS